MPSLLKLAKEYEDKGLVFVAASRDEMPDAPLFVQEFVQSRMPELAPYVVFAPDELAAIFQVTALPTLYLLDRKGQVVDSQRGMMSEAALRQRIERALK
ncbi:TlpA family protein disulfide reductase [Cystobacter fuscus]